MPNFVTDNLFIQPRSSHEDLVKVRSLVERILRDPLKAQQLCDRVYQLMQEDLERQQKRSRSYGGWY